VVQWRAKHASDVLALEIGEALRRRTADAGVAFVVNDRFDWALALGADGVHLGQDDLPPARIPEEARARLRIGRSTHDATQAARACDEPIDYIALGPVFGTTSKDSPHPALGLARVREMAELVRPRPLVCIGGITEEHAPALREAGASGFAVISAVAGAEDPEAAVRALARAFEQADG